MAAAKKDPVKAAQKKKKMIAIGGGVLLLLILVVQVPRTMKMLHPKPLIDANGNALGKDGKPVMPPAPPPGTSVPLAAPTLAGGAPTLPLAGAAPAASAGSLVDTRISPDATQSQLASFGRFASKDPFQQQVKPGSTGDTAPSSPALPPTGGKSPGVPTSPALPNVPTYPSGTPSVPSAPAVAPTSAQISVNGVPETVALAADFPAAAPVFQLVSLTATSAKIGIAGGSYANGAPTVTLKKGKTLTLMNTADGTRYVLQLVSTGTAPAAPPATAPPAPVAPTPPPAAATPATVPPSIGTPTPAGR